MQNSPVSCQYPEDGVPPCPDISGYSSLFPVHSDRADRYVPGSLSLFFYVSEPLSYPPDCAPDGGSTLCHLPISSDFLYVPLLFFPVPVRTSGDGFPVFRLHRFPEYFVLILPDTWHYTGFPDGYRIQSGFPVFLFFQSSRGSSLPVLRLYSPHPVLLFPFSVYFQTGFPAVVCYPEYVLQKCFSRSGQVLFSPVPDQLPAVWQLRFSP